MTNMEQTFFPVSRREVTLQSPSGLCNTADERRIKFSVKMPLDSQNSVLGMPEWVFEGLHDVEKAASGIAEVSYDIILDPMTLEFYGLQETETRQHMITGCKMSNFAVKRDGSAEDAEIVLACTVHTMHTKGTWDWLGEIHSRTVFAKFTATQPALEFKEPEVVFETQEDIFSDPNPEAAKEACKPENDVAWEVKLSNGAAEARRPRGFGRSKNAVAVN